MTQAMTQEGDSGEQDVTHATATLRRGAGRPTREQAEARHEEMLDAALDLFLEHGFELTTIEMVAARVSMTRRTVYAWYVDKAVLFRTAVQRAIERQIVPADVLAGFDQGNLPQRLNRSPGCASDR